MATEELEPGRILADEAAFADSEYLPHKDDLLLPSDLHDRYYSRSKYYRYEQSFGNALGNISGAKVLDIGCGTGQEAVFLALLGARVTAIDISPVGLDIARRRAQHYGVDVDFQGLPCPTRFPPESFDIVHGVGILHHTGLDVGMQETKRLLRPGGTAVFLEPIGNSATVERVKKWLRPKLPEKYRLTSVTEHETVFHTSDVLAYRKQFASLEIRPYRLTMRGRKFVPRMIWPWMERFDHFALKLPMVAQLAGLLFVHIVK